MPVQHCQRCAADVPVRGYPLPWCPRCGGVLSAPVATLPWTTRWVAHVPPGVGSAVVLPAALGPTPRYDRTPRWGLPARLWVHPMDLAASPGATARASSLAAGLRPLLAGVTVAFGLAAGAQAWRYTLLVRGRSVALDVGGYAWSDAVNASVGVLAPVLAVIGAVVAALWLVQARRAAADWAGLRDTRSARAVLLGALLPGVNLAQAGVLVTEVERTLGVAAPSRRVRCWWAVFALTGLLTALSVGWRALDTAQARADAVVLMGITDLAAAATAVLTLLVVGTITARLEGATPSLRRRWVASVPAPAAELTP